MSFQGRAFGAASQQFCDHLNRLLNTTIARARVVHTVRSRQPRVADIHLRQGVLPGARLVSRYYGHVHLPLGQYATSEPNERGWHRLHTVRYRYALSAGLTRDALLRWESSGEREHGADLWCRQHLQGTPRVHLPRGPVALNDLHLPTGQVAIEDIIRFCIVDLGVAPLSDDWDAILRTSASAFRDRSRGSRQ